MAKTKHRQNRPKYPRFWRMPAPAALPAAHLKRSGDSLYGTLQRSSEIWLQDDHHGHWNPVSSDQVLAGGKNPPIAEATPSRRAWRKLLERKERLFRISTKGSNVLGLGPNRASGGSGNFFCPDLSSEAISARADACSIKCLVVR